MSSSSDIHHFHLTVELLVSATGWFEIDELIRKRQRMESFAVDQVMFCSFHAVRCQLSCCGLYVCRLSIVAISKCAVECGVEFVLQFCEIWVLQFCYVHKHKHSPASLGCLCGGNFCVWSWMWSVEDLKWPFRAVYEGIQPSIYDSWARPLCKWMVYPGVPTKSLRPSFMHLTTLQRPVHWS